MATAITSILIRLLLIVILPLALVSCKQETPPGGWMFPTTPKTRAQVKRSVFDEWKQFRNNEKACKGTVTTWRVKVAYIDYGGDLRGYFGPGSSRPFIICGPEGFLTYQAAELAGEVPTVHADDWIVVTGRFRYVSSDGAVVLSAIRVKNEGYK